MKHKVIYFNEKNYDKIVFARQILFNSDNSEDRKRMKKIISKALNEELTEKQKACVVAYYLEGRKMIDIAQDLGVAPSTVKRHIQSGKHRLMKIAKYYM